MDDGTSQASDKILGKRRVNTASQHGGEKQPPTPHYVVLTQPQHGGEKYPPPAFYPLCSIRSLCPHAFFPADLNTFSSCHEKPSPPDECWRPCGPLGVV